MLIVAQSQEKGFKTEIPQPPANPDSAPRPVRTIVIQLGEAKGGDVPLLKINQQDVSWPDLKTQLTDIFKTRAEKVAFVQGDDEVNFEFVAYVIDTARDAGVERVGLLPKEMAASR
jgi:biopolymer transport protein ExbD